MSKILKRVLIFGIIAIVAVVALGVFVIIPVLAGPQPTPEESGTSVLDLAESSEHVDLDPESGIVYVNDEVVVFARPAITQEQMEALAKEQGATLDSTMADDGIYRLTYPEPMTMVELDERVEALKASPNVADATLNPVTSYAPDDEGATDAEASVPEDPIAGMLASDGFTQREPVYPNDPWAGDVGNGSTWNMLGASGSNWGMEAIKAPSAWGYLQDARATAPIKIGLIDTYPELDHPELGFAAADVFVVDDSTGAIQPNPDYGIQADDHGTHVSGIMNAAWNNESGVSGVMGGKGELHYAAVFRDTGTGAASRYYDGYTFLVALKTLIDQDVQAINISLNTNRLVGFAASHGNEKALNYLNAQADVAEKGLARIIERRQFAGKPDFVVCVAAGNNNDTPYFRDPNATWGYRTADELNKFEETLFFFGFNREEGGAEARYNNFLNAIDDETVANHIVVVGSCRIDTDAFSPFFTAYEYSKFSNIGDRVDVVAPGEDVYSLVADDGYDYMSGTSMATPHVTGAAGLVFAANPSLSAADVKTILTNSSQTRFYFEDGMARLLNAYTSTVFSLMTEDHSVNSVVNNFAQDGLDVCFVVDTTNSMGDDIQNARENMTEILTSLGEKTQNYRVALIDYRDFASRTGDSDDYPSQIQLNFTDDDAAIRSAIDGLTLGYGGDTEETVYSALMQAVDLPWRENAQKVVIILGDAAPLDPEPETNYTYDDVRAALLGEDVGIDVENSDERALGSLGSGLTVYSIGASASDDASGFFKDVADDTGGSYAGVDDASGISDAIITSIEQIELATATTVNVDFGPELANSSVCLADESGNFITAVTTDDEGRFTFEDLDPLNYTWTSDGLYQGGTLAVGEGASTATAQVENVFWFAPVASFWHDHAIVVIIFLAAIIALCTAIPIAVGKGASWRRARREKAAAAAREKAAAEAARMSQATPSAPVQTPPAPTAPPTRTVPATREAPHAPASRGTAPSTAPTMPAGERRVKYCPKCGHECAPEAAFCPHCGANVGERRGDGTTPRSSQSG